MMTNKIVNGKKLEIMLDSSKNLTDFVTPLYAQKKLGHMKIVPSIGEDLGAKRGIFKEKNKYRRIYGKKVL